MFSLAIAKLWVKLTGFQVVGHELVAQHKTYVVIAAPHTSNWDLAHTLATGRLLNIDIKWVGKHTLFQFPLGWLMRRLGGVPVDRRAAHGMVQAFADLFKSRDDLVLLVPPEGTRSAGKLWKSGFYHIAKTANVPIACAFVDYARKMSGVGLFLFPSADLKSDMDQVRAFYAPIRGRYPQKETIPRLKEENQ